VAARRLDPFTRFVIGNTWAWPKADLGTQALSRILDSPPGSYLIRCDNIFVKKILPPGVRRTVCPMR
jgi:haloalkane dehalogenase